MFSTQNMVKEDIRRGDIPKSRDAYVNSVKIAVPAVAEMVSIALMGMIDMIMVGRLGSNAVAAVGLTNQPRMLFLSIFFALNVSITAIIARKKGEGDMAAARSCLRHAIVIVALLGSILTIVAFSAASPLMGFAGAQPDTLQLAATYFRISALAIPFQILTGAICAAQRACGNTKITMKVNVVAKVLNVLLNFLLIEGRLGAPRLEIAGAAWSTVIASGVAFTMVLFTVLHKDSVLKISHRDRWLPEIPMLQSIKKLSSGSILEQMALRFGFFAYARVVAELGTAEFTAHMIAMQLMGLSFTFADGISAATTSLVGQSLGQKRPDLSIMYGKIGMRLAIICAAMLAITCVLLRYHFPLIFIDDPVADADIIAKAAGVILILAAIMPFQTSQLVMAGSLRGAGDTRYVAMTMLVAVAILRPAMGFLFTFPLGLGLAGAWIALIFDQVARLVMLFTRFAGGKWIKAKV